MPSQNLNHTIGKSEANMEINQYLQLKTTGYSIVNTAINTLGGSAPLKEFYSTVKNAFLFDRKDVLKFFYGHNAVLPELEVGTAEHLLLILGAHTPNKRGFVEGSPTIIMVGVKQTAAPTESDEDDDAIFFKTTFDDGSGDPGTQWETQYKVDVFPDPLFSPMAATVNNPDLAVEKTYMTGQLPVKEAIAKTGEPITQTEIIFRLK